MNKLKKGLLVLQKLNNSGYKAFIVGGAVRDFLLNRSINDIDIATEANVNDIINIFDNYDSKASKYAGVTVFYEGETFEITSFRRDVMYEDHRHPVVEFVDNINLDLARRDFTVNAFAMDCNMNIIDLFMGVNDLNNKIIRCIGKADIRFDEDALRVLRAVYFCGKLGFRLDEEIINSIINYDYVSYLPKEYIKVMLEKILEQENKIGLEYIVKYNILRGFPFYQVVAEECFKYNVNKKDMYALFYTLHGFLPANERITSEEYKYAKSIGMLIRSNFSAISLYESKGNYLKEASSLFECIYNKIDVVRLYQNLPIHNVKDIDFDFNKLENQKKRSVIQRKVEESILNKELENKYDEIASFVYLRRYL